MASSGGAGLPLVTAAVLLETSLGPLVVDLYGADCPAATAHFANLCRARYFNGAVATSVLPDRYVVFTPTVASLVDETFYSLLRGGHGGAYPVEEAVSAEWQAMHHATVVLRRGSDGPKTVRRQPSGAIDRKGLVLMELIRRPPPATVFLASHVKIMLTSRPAEFLEADHIVIGEVVEGLELLDRFRTTYAHTAQPSVALTGALGLDHSSYMSTASYLSKCPRPVRLLRIKHTAVLPTVEVQAAVEAAVDLPIAAGSPTDTVPPASGRATEPFSFFYRPSGSIPAPAATGPQSSATAPQLVRAFDGLRPFRFWASEADVHRVNAEIRRRVTQGGSPFVATSSDGENETPSSTAGRTRLYSPEYNPHFHGDYLSSDGEEIDGGVATASSSMTPAAARALREAKQKEALAIAQAKLNETRALTLRVLDDHVDLPGLTDGDTSGGGGGGEGGVNPPETVLFVCKLNPFTTSEGLRMCFSQFGTVIDAEVIYDKQQQQRQQQQGHARQGPGAATAARQPSLCYGFVEFADRDACFRAFQKMDRALIDDCRIRVDFSQSVSKIWRQRVRDFRTRAHQAVGLKRARSP